MTKRTCTYMFYTDGITCRYAVVVGKMCGRSIDAHTADTLATYETIQKPSDELYRELTARHATKRAPAVYWQA